MRIPKPLFDRTAEYVFVRPTRRGGQIQQPGTPVPSETRRYLRRRWARTGRIGPVDHPWTEAALQRSEARVTALKNSREDAKITDSDIANAKTTIAKERSGLSDDSWNAQDDAIRSLLILEVSDADALGVLRQNRVTDEPGTNLDTSEASYRSIGGGWFEILIGADVVDKVQGRIAAESTVKQLNAG